FFRCAQCSYLRASDIASAPPEERCHGGMLPVHHYARYLKERSGTCRLQSTGLAAAVPCTRGYAAPHVSNKPQTAGAGLFSLILRRFITAPTLHSPLNWKTWGSPHVLSLREASPLSVGPGIRPRPTTPAPLESRARLLIDTRVSPALVIRATGVVHQLAVQATGKLTFYNIAPSVQQIPAGMVFNIAGGMQVISDRAATLPAGNPPDS